MDQKRFLLFVVLSVAVMWGYVLLRSVVAPPPPRAPQAPEELAQQDEPPEAAPAGEKEPMEEGPAAPGEPGGEAAEETAKEEPAGEDEAPPPGPAEPTRPLTPGRLATLGSVDSSPESPATMLVTFNSRGASIERIELSDPKYRDLEFRGGYLGWLGLVDVENGCRVRAVGAGTPAASAAAASGVAPPGLRPDDILLSVDGVPVATAAMLQHYLSEETRPGDTVRLEVQRPDSGDSTIEFTATLTRRPLEVIRPEPDDAVFGQPRDPLSCLLTLQGASPDQETEKAPILDSLLRDNWEMTVIEPPEGPAVEFTYVLEGNQQKTIGRTGRLEIKKRYRLASSEGGERRPYHLEMTLEIRNLDETAESEVVYRMDGPNGLPLEGWWYSRKIHPRMFASAGARDVIWQVAGQEYMLLGCSEMFKYATKNPESRAKSLLQEPARLQFVGVDAQYFACALLPAKGDEEKFSYQYAAGLAIGELQEKKSRRTRTTNVTFRLVSQPLKIPAGQSYQQRFLLFAGPKDPKVLADYGLGAAVEYGWFPWIAKPLSAVLHFFYSIVHNYGLAIIMLTVLVRGCMFPIGRKAARNAQMMQQLAPELKKITEKYKKDMEKRAQAQRELYKKHSFNPFGGCLLMFLQLPIFIGLYRSLSVDINLRQAPFIPWSGISWCSNLAGPDMFWRWDGILPEMLAGKTGWLGPYLNILPIITIVLFIMQQKLFTPPATDEQSRMQQSMMKYMMIFMGVLFFKVPSGLCLYFIASSIWGIAERKMLPKTPQPGGGKPAAVKEAVSKRDAASSAARPGPNGSSRKTAAKKKKQKRK